MKKQLPRQYLFAFGSKAAMQLMRTLGSLNYTGVFMKKEIIDIEKKILIISVTGTIVFAVIGLSIFLISKSQAVLLDSLFSLIFGIVTLISIWVVSVSSKNPSDEYPFGLVQARPMIELFKGLLIIGFIISAIINAINTILSGGAIISGKIILYYSLLSVVISIIIIVTIYYIGKKADSSLVKLEIIQWIQDTIISLSIGIVFGITFLIKHPFIDLLALYLDSILVIIIGILFLPSILKVVISSGRQLLLSSPPDEVKNDIGEYIVVLCKKHNLEIKQNYYILTGGVLYIDIELYVKDKIWNWDIINGIRNNTDDYIKSKYPDSEIFISFFDINNEGT